MTAISGRSCDYGLVGGRELLPYHSVGRPARRTIARGTTGSFSIVKLLLRHGGSNVGIRGATAGAVWRRPLRRRWRRGAKKCVEVDNLERVIQRVRNVRAVGAPLPLLLVCHLVLVLVR